MPKSIDEGAFSWHNTRDGKVFISFYGKRVMTLKGKRALKFQDRIRDLSSREQQLEMARITGNFKRGNE